MGIAKWDTVSGPIEKLLTTRGDLIMIIATLTTFAPLLYLSLVTVLRALLDLKNFTPLQAFLFFSLVFGSAASFVITTKGKLWTPESLLSTWDQISDPMEEVLKNYSDQIAAGAALMAMAPMLYCVLATVIRSIWNLRVKLVVEE